MNCRDFEADVVDLARGAGTSAAADARVSAHIQQCAGCATRFARERELTTALKAVAAEVSPSTRSEAIEAQLLAAFADRQAAAPPKVRSGRPAIVRPAVRAWLAAAAVLVLAVAVWQGAVRWRSESGVIPASTQAAARPAGPAPTTSGVAVSAGIPGPAATPATETPATATPPERPARTRLEPAVAPRQSAPGQSTLRTARTRESDVLRFVALPTAIGLPPIESGHIVRVEVPTAMLPAYGIDVAPDSGAGMVEADVLVGQDGQPRAIRFVTLDSDSRRRQ
jgi:hypothetical protein